MCQTVLASVLAITLVSSRECADLPVCVSETFQTLYAIRVYKYKTTHRASASILAGQQILTTITFEESHELGGYDSTSSRPRMQIISPEVAIRCNSAVVARRVDIVEAVLAGIEVEALKQFVHRENFDLGIFEFGLEFHCLVRVDEIRGKSQLLDLSCKTIGYDSGSLIDLLSGVILECEFQRDHLKEDKFAITQLVELTESPKDAANVVEDTSPSEWVRLHVHHIASVVLGSVDGEEVEVICTDPDEGDICISVDFVDYGFGAKARSESSVIAVLNELNLVTDRGDG